MKVSKKNLMYYITILFYSLFNIALAYVTVSSNKQIFIKQVNTWLPLVVMLLFNVFLLWRLKKLEKKRIIKFFAFSLVIFGILYFLLMPFGRVPDESTHFFRAYEISEGHFLTPKNDDGIGGMERSLDFLVLNDNKSFMTYNNLLKSLNIKGTDGEKIFFNYSTASLYSPFSYIPQVVGIVIARIFTSSLLVQAYAGRFFNLLFCILLLTMAYKIIPTHKNVILMLALVPITCQEIISLAADGVTISLVILFVAYIMRLRHDKEKPITKENVFWLFTLALCMSLSKIVYAPICLLAFLIPESKFKKKSDKYKIIFIVGFVLLILNLGWLTLATGYLNEYSEGVNSGLQVKFILTHPVHYLLVLLRTISKMILPYLLQLSGQILEWLDFSLTYIYPIAYLFLLGFVIIVCHDEECSRDISVKALCGLVFCIIVFLIFTSLYVQWTSVGYKEILGVQGRYFIPIIILLPCVFCSRKIKISNPFVITKLVYFVLIGYNIYTLCSLFLLHIY